MELNMSRWDFLGAIAEYTEALFKDVRLPKNIDPEEIAEADPDALFAEDGEEITGLNVYRMRLPDMESNVSCAPYCLHQIVTGTDGYDRNGDPVSKVLLRSVFCIYHPLPTSLTDSYDKGAERAIEVVERFRIAVLSDGMIANRFVLDLEDGGLETLYYPDDMRPYHIAEVASNWRLPPVKRTFREYLRV